MKKILVTGAAGFIGFHMARKLVERGEDVVGLDNLITYYDIDLKFKRLKFSGILSSDLKHGTLQESSKYVNYKFVQLGLEENVPLQKLFRDEKFDFVVNLAAQAGVRYSIKRPDVYIESNIIGFANILEACRNNNIEHLIYGSSSSVYGMSSMVPYSTKHPTDHPISLYAATKKSNELLAHTYSHLFQLPTSGVRFFTVYGPWGRPDMAYFIFANKIMKGEPIDVYNNGEMERDFTYVDDIVDGTIKIMYNKAQSNPDWSPSNMEPNSSLAPYKIYNIGANKPVKLLRFIQILELCLGRKTKKNFMPIQPGDVLKTWANIDDLVTDFDYKPTTSLEDGISKFVDWYKKFYNHKP
jgi:UDP-glucuronate 4-epimerase